MILFFHKKIQLLIISLLSYFLVTATLIAAEPKLNCHFDNNNQVTIDNVAWQQLFQTAESYQRSENYEQSIGILQQAFKMTSDPIEKAISLGSLGYACFMISKIDQAAQLLKNSVDAFAKAKALDSNTKVALATTLNNLGNVCATYQSKNQAAYENKPHFKAICGSVNHQPNRAITYYKQSADLATQAGNQLLRIKAQINLVQTALKDTSQVPIVKKMLLDLLEQIHVIQSSQPKIEVLLRLSRLIRQTYLAQPAYAPELRLKAFKVLAEARQLAHQNNDIWGKSQALGYLGQLYFDEGQKRYQEALQATRQAIQLADEDTFSHNELAALGLGGIAHRAGIHSAIASLWKADDKFASLFMPIFYEELLKSGSKAKALQQAQKRIWKRKPIYKEPRYWAAFILIGNWLK